MSTFVYEVDDFKNQKSIELDLPFSGEWSKDHSIVQGDLDSDCTVILKARLQARLVSEIFEIPIDYLVAFVVVLKEGRVSSVDFEFEIFAEYNFDNDDSIRSKFIEKIESNYSIDSVRFV